MELTINYWAVLGCGIFAMVLGSLWYGPLFKKRWMEVIGATALDEIKRKEMEKKAMPLYLVQFVLVLFQAWILAYYIAGWQHASGVVNALWIWAAFIMPMIAAGAMWNNDSARISWTRFGIQASYQLICFVVFGLILQYWK